MATGVTVLEAGIAVAESWVAAQGVYADNVVKSHLKEWAGKELSILTKIVKTIEKAQVDTEEEWLQEILQCIIQRAVEIPVSIRGVSTTQQRHSGKFPRSPRTQHNEDIIQPLSPHSGKSRKSDPSPTTTPHTARIVGPEGEDIIREERKRKEEERRKEEQEKAKLLYQPRKKASGGQVNQGWVRAAPTSSTPASTTPLATTKHSTALDASEMPEQSPALPIQREREEEGDEREEDEVWQGTSPPNNLGEKKERKKLLFSLRDGLRKKVSRIKLTTIEEEEPEMDVVPTYDRFGMLIVNPKPAETKVKVQETEKEEEEEPVVQRDRFGMIIIPQKKPPPGKEKEKVKVKEEKEEEEEVRMERDRYGMLVVAPRKKEGDVSDETKKSKPAQKGSRERNQTDVAGGRRRVGMRASAGAKGMNGGMVGGLAHAAVTKLQDNRLEALSPRRKSVGDSSDNVRMTLEKDPDSFDRVKVIEVLAKAKGKGNLICTALQQTRVEERTLLALVTSMQKYLHIAGDSLSMISADLRERNQKRLSDFALEEIQQMEELHAQLQELSTNVKNAWDGFLGDRRRSDRNSKLEETLNSVMASLQLCSTRLLIATKVII